MNSHLPCRRYVLGLAALLSMSCVFPLRPLHAADPGPIDPMPPSIQDTQREPQQFDIPAQSLMGGLTAFAEQSGWQVFYSSDLAEGLSTEGVHGPHQPEQALQFLLAGTGMTYRITGASSVTIERTATKSLPPIPMAPGTPDPSSAQSKNRNSAPNRTKAIKVPEILVKDIHERDEYTSFAVPESTVGTKTDTPILEVPQSISVITRKEMERRAVTSVGDAIRYTPGVMAEGFGFDSRGFDWFFLRGFDALATNDYRDGLRQVGRNFTFFRTETFGLDRVEVLRGPSSILFGQGDAGGIINRVSKMPSLDAPREIRLQLGNFNRRQIAADVGGAVTDSGNLLYRLVGVGLESGSQDKYTNGTVVGNDRLYVAPSVTWKMSEKTTLTVLADVLINRTDGFGFSYTTPQFEATRLLTGEPSFNKFSQDQYTGGYRFEHRFDSVWTFRQHMRHAQAQADYFRVSDFALDVDGRTLLRDATIFNDRIHQTSLDNQLQAKFSLGKTEHIVLAGIDWWRADADTKIYNGDAPSLDVQNPLFGQAINRPGNPTTDNRQNLQQLGFYLQEQLKIDTHWLLTLGLRHDRTSVKTDDRLSANKQTQDDNAFTFRTGLTYLTDIGVAPYVSYTESFLPQAGLDINGKQFDPTRGKQYELGVKYRPRGIPALLTVAFYDLTKTNVLTPDPTDALFSRQTGEVRSRGIEAEIKATLSEGLNFLAAYSFNDLKVTESNDVDLNKRPIIVPKHMANAWLDYTIPSGPLAGFGGGIGARYVGARFNDLENTSTQSAYTLADAMVHYERGPWRYALNANNVFNTNYTANCSFGFCYRGLERTVLATIRYRW